MKSISLGKSVFTLRGGYIEGTEYQPLDVVRFEGKPYACLEQTREKPTKEDNSYWMLLFDSTAGGTSSGTTSASPSYELCEFYYFRHPTLKAGFQPAQGGVITNAASLYPEAWEYLKSSEGQKLCKTEADWQAMTSASWATLADGTKVGWNGIGGAPFYAPDLNAGSLRLPDLRGMYSEAAGFDSLSVGATHGDATRNIEGYMYGNGFTNGVSGTGGAIYSYKSAGASHYGGNTIGGLAFSSSRVVPTANKNQPRAWGALACVYLGLPSK